MPRITDTFEVPEYCNKHSHVCRFFKRAGWGEAECVIFGRLTVQKPVRKWQRHTRCFRAEERYQEQLKRRT